MAVEYSIEELDALDDNALKQLDWKSSRCLNGRLLELHAEGQLGNELLAKLPLKPILCIDQITRIDEDAIEATFSFPSDQAEWPYDGGESLEMLFQDQLDQLVGFWGARKANGIGRALSSGKCQQLQSLDFEAGKKITFVLDRRKWVENKETGTATAVFNGRILDQQGDPMLETKNVIVGILPPADILALRQQYGGTLGVAAATTQPQALQIPLYDPATIEIESDGSESGNPESDKPVLSRVSATQQINPELWPLRYHFRGDPVVPGNFGTHGMIALLKQVAVDRFAMTNPLFDSMAAKKFSGMIFEDPKQIRFELLDVADDGEGGVVAAVANLYLESANGERMIETPIYTFKKIRVTGKV